MSYFLTPEGRLRAGWRLLLFILFFLIAGIVFGAAASAFLRRQSIASQAGLFAATTVAATWLMMRLFEQQPFWTVGLALQPEWRGEMRLGLAGGMVLVATIGMVEWAVGAIHFEPSGVPATSLPAVVLGVTGILAISATTEELLFRGYPLQRLIEASNGTAALAISSLVFGALHARNPYATRLSIINTVLAGVLLSSAYLQTRALWFPIGFHFSWNWMQSLVGMPVSGLEVVKMPWRAVPSFDYVWFHGGDYGPEGGVVATVALLVGIVYLLRKGVESPPPGVEIHCD